MTEINEAWINPSFNYLPKEGEEAILLDPNAESQGDESQGSQGQNNLSPTDQLTSDELTEA
jgi:hypothetical protein